ncbi:MAG: site-specific integrase [Clostridia bacterium]|nr:site-specific integrase [Clostridia bacterium]
MIERAVEERMNAMANVIPLTGYLDNFTGHTGTGGTDNMYAMMPLKDYIRRWLDTFKAETVKTSSLARLEGAYRTLLDFDIAQMPAADITAMDIQRYVNELNSHGYAINTIRKQLRIVTAPLRQAAAMHEIPTDPSVGVRLPKEERLKKQTRLVEPYTEEEQERLWRVIDEAEHPGILAIGLMLETGLRSGELLALRWDRIDIPGKRLRVEATITDPVGKTRAAWQNSPKTKSSRRVVPLTPRAISVLERLQGLDDTWVIASSRGGWISYQNLIKHIKQACRKADIPYRGAHVFRHTFATNCYYKGVDVKVLSRLLGHSDIKVTMNIYVSLRGDGFDEMYAALVG